MRSWMWATASVATLLSGQALAADADATVDPVTVIATRTETLVSEVPASVSVIGAETIERRLATDIKDLVRYEPGVSVRSSPARFGAALGTTGRDGNSGFNIRGLEGSRVLQQVDGVRTPDGFTFGAQSVGRGEYSDLDLLKRVEILRGPASALYGSDGVAGAVSFTTKDPDDFLHGGDLALRAKGAYASADESWTGGLTAAGRQGRWSGMVAYTRREGHEQETQGENEARNTDRTTANPQDWSSDAILAKGVFDLDAANRFRLTYESFQRDVSTDVLSGIAKPPLATTSVLRLLAEDTTERDRVSFDHLRDGEGLFHQVFWSTYWQDAQTVQFSAEDRNTAADRSRLNTFDNRVIGASLQVDSRLGAHHLVWGGDVSVTRQEGIRDGTAPPVGETYPMRAFPITDYTLAGVFVQDELSLFDGKLKLFPALRYDAYELEPEADAALGAFAPAGQSDGRLSPKFAVVLAPNEGVNLFANYAQGFKAPTPSQVNNAFYNPIQNYRSIPNPDLKPETSETIEGGVRFADKRSDLRWSAGLTAFAGWYEDFIEQAQVAGDFTPANPAVYQVVNVGRVKIRGLEGRAEASFANGFGAIIAASYSEGETIGAGKAPLDSIDPVKLSAGLTYEDPEGRFGGALEAVYSDDKRAGDVAQACTGGCFLPPSFTIVDLTVWWNVTDRVRLNAGVFNLTDETYWWWSDVRGLSATAVSRDAYTQPGRNYAVSLTWTL